MESSEPVHQEQINPSVQRQEDGYSRGVNLFRLIASEFGISPLVVESQLAKLEDNVEITIDGEDWRPEDKRQRFMIPYDVIKNKTVTVVAESLHFKFQFKG